LARFFNGRTTLLTREENELLCRIGATTPMGQMARRYWIPAATSDEVTPKGRPKRVRLLGEDFVLFRDDRGRVGLLDELCPHRGASLVLAQNEECGLRCLYHGWKIDVDGRVLETPVEPEDSTFKDRVRAVSYPVYEAGGIIWAYLGPLEEKPPRLNFDFTLVPDSHRVILKLQIACNWVQAVEGAIDSAHSNILHADTFRPEGSVGAVSVLRRNLAVDRPSNDTRPKLEVQDTDYGFRYAAIRVPIVSPETQRYVRVTEFVAPFYAMFPAPQGFGNVQAFVPLDDEHTLLYFIKINYDEPIDVESRELHYRWSGLRPGVDVDAEYRSKRTRANNWLQDRDAMERGELFSGIAGVQNQDAVVQESMGPIYDRTKEHLGTSDVAVIRMRRLMIGAVRAFIDRNEPPLGLSRPIDYASIQAQERMLPLGGSWQSWYSASATSDVAG
jgi:phthalate 4,5-dioxygenase oxygenase subunit